MASTTLTSRRARWSSRPTTRCWDGSASRPARSRWTVPWPPASTGPHHCPTRLPATCWVTCWATTAPVGPPSRRPGPSAPGPADRATAMTASGRLSRWANELAPGAIPAEVRRAAVLHLLDGVGCAIGGRDEPAARAAVAVATLATAPSEATVLGRPGRWPAPAAALANGTLVHALDFDDTHAGGLVHATAAVLPTALAVGQEVGATGAEIVTAAVAGYEAVCALAAAVPHGFHGRGFHATGVCGVFTSALIAARLYGLSPEVTVHALGIAGSSAAGSLEFLHSPATTKQLHPGLSAQAGITAARLARAGATGPATTFEGEHGLFRSYLGVDLEPDELFGASLGRDWELPRISLKPFPACQLSHATLHAAARARDLLPSGWADRVTRIVTWLPEESVPIVA